MTLIAVFGLTAAMYTCGAAIDYLSALNIKTKNQGALDAAVLATVRNAKSESDAQKILKDYYQSNGGLGSISDMKYYSDPSGVAVSATSSYDMQNAFAAFLRPPTTRIALKSKATAQPALTSMTIETGTAVGAWSKTITLHNLDPKTGVDTTLATLVYRFDQTPAYTGTVSSDVTGPITIENAKQLYFKMEIDSDPQHSWFTQWIDNAVVRTDDPKTSNQIYVDNVQMATGIPVNLATVIPCGKKIQMSWEDGGNPTTQDFFFYITGQCTITEGSPLRLIN